MKKLIVLLFSILMLAGFSMVVNAETLPVKDIVYYDESSDDIYVLLENGSLLYGDSIDTPNPIIVSQNVKEIVSYGNYFLLIHKDNTVSRLNCYEYIGNKKVIKNTVEKFSNTFEEALDIEAIGDYYLYIDKNNILKKYDKHKKTSIQILENVKKLDINIVLTLNNELYYIDYKNYNEIQCNFIIGNVTDVINNGTYCVFLRQNKGLYSFSLNEYSGEQYLMPIRISPKVDSINNVILNNEFCYYMLGDEVYRYRCDTGKSLGLFADDVKKIQQLDNVYTIYNSGRVDIGNTLYLSKSEDIQQFIGSRDFYLTSNGDLYKRISNSNTKFSKYFSNVKKIIIEEGKNFDETFFFVTNDGKLYSATGYVYNLDKPYLTSFCEKRTKVIINDKEVELETKIQIVNNRSMYPFRECLENMGALVMWDSTNRIAIGELNGITVEFPIDKNYYYINGEIHHMDTTSYISNGRTYIPIRFAAEALGFTVEWESTSVENKISIFE